MNFARRKLHRGVAPIIATLLLIAITVIGGVMIYLFTQGFFGNSISALPTADTIIMSGYDMRELEGKPPCNNPNNPPIAVSPLMKGQSFVTAIKMGTLFKAANLTRKLEQFS